MNIDHWRTHYRSNPKYQETMYKKLPCFEQELKGISSGRKVCFPLPFVELFKQTPYAFSNGRYTMEGSIIDVDHFHEELELEFLCGVDKYSLLLRAFHSNSHRRIQLNVSHTVINVPDEIRLFLAELYHYMNEFLFTYSSRRLDMVTSEYQVEIPDWLVNSINQIKRVKTQ